MDKKPTVEQALLFKRLSQSDWFGVRDHVIKQCLEATNWDEEAAHKYLNNHFIPPRPGGWCPRWSFSGEQIVDEGDSDVDTTEWNQEASVAWYLVEDRLIDGKHTTIPLDENLEPTNITGKKMSKIWTLNRDGTRGDMRLLEEETDGTEGYAYRTFTAASNALHARPDKFNSVLIQCPNQQRLKFNSQIG